MSVAPVLFCALTLVLLAVLFLPDPAMMNEPGYQPPGWRLVDWLKGRRDR